jgi:hypothetical protein
LPRNQEEMIPAHAAVEKNIKNAVSKIKVEP